MPNTLIMTNCSGLAIKDGFERIVKSHIPQQKIIGERNFYKKDTRERVNTLTMASLKGNQMEEYIAASVIVHSSDGWNYLTRSVESLINGDVASAIHFAYYAELRSAMSLMAYDGVGIFDQQHIWYNAAKVPTLFRGFTTHSGADLGMKEWAKVAAKKDVLFNLIRVNNHSLGDWIRETGVSTKSKYVNSIISEWLRKWSIDLHLKQDQSIRNIMSYRPHFAIPEIDIEQTLEKLTHIWELLEPQASGGFPVLDRYLLRIAMEEVYKKSTGRIAAGAPYHLFLTNIFGRLGEDPAQPLFNFLIRATLPDDAIVFSEAQKDKLDPLVNKNDPFPLICRAILLLRLATGSANDLLEDSSLNKADLRFWWENICLEQGLTNTTPSGIDTADLYTDVRDSIDEMSNYPSGSFNSIKESFNSISQELFYLKQFQRPGLWGLGL